MFPLQETENRDCGLIGEQCWVSDWVSGAVGDAIENLARAVMEGLSQMVTTLATFWVDMPTSNLTTGDGVTASPTVAFLQNGLWFWTATLAVLAVIVGGIRLVWEQKGAPVRDLLRSLLTLTLVSGMGLAVIALLIVAADGFSSWIIDTATDGNGFANSLELLVLMDQQGIGVFLLIILGLIGIITSVIQIVLMVIRSGMLVILAGILPTTAAFTNTEMGRQWFQKSVGWTLAFILYKPAAAIVYAVAFRLMGTQWGGADSALLNTITGMALMVVALFALPALMRFVTPMVGAVAAGAGGGAMAGGAVGALATGAVSMGSAGRGSGSASPAPASSQSAGKGQQSSSGAPSGSAAGSGGGGGGAKPTPGATGGGGGQPGGGTPTPAGAAASGAPAGAAAGPAGAAVAAGAKAVKGGSQAVKQVSDEAAGEGPSGSNSK